MNHFDEACKWMTTLLDHPETHLDKALVIVGGAASGKSTFAKLLSNYCEADDLKAVYRSFFIPLNSYMKDSRLIVVDEPANTWRDWIGKLINSTDVVIERKGVGPETVPNRSGFLVLTSGPVAFDPGQRRFIVLTPLQAFAALAAI